jgi:hypothetical protein
MAVLNNPGKVHQALGQADDAGHFFHQLLLTLIYIWVVSSSNNAVGSTTDFHLVWDAFFATLIFPKSSSTASTA